MKVKGADIERARKTVKRRARDGNGYVKANHVTNHFDDIDASTAGRALKELDGDIIKLFTDGSTATYRILKEEL